ncbi:hypothetical protein CPT_Moby_294 [Stenotrophomonas phage Moby]|uniref:Terminase small subunit n=1 Tax=Stenotrophomonas phage Moby TaxID=2601680 RepID=A0A5P8PMY1_9CAUD|nr:terminase small subunit [Stenotrophomonas phage Moby]QFR58019.1 hypothetical protein CPT_Moby_294 [Stenotrophomonas phage Moby]
MTDPLDMISQTLNTITGMDKLPRESQVEIDAEEDYLTARKNLKELVETGMEIVPDMLAVMTATQDPKMYQAAAAILKSVAALNAQMMDVSSKREKNTRLPTPQKPEDSTTHIEAKGPVYIGTTADIIKQRRLAKEKEQAIDVEAVQVKDPRQEEEIPGDSSEE